MTHTIKCFIAHSSKNRDYAHNLEHSVPNIDCFTISDADLLDKESLSGAIKLLDKPGFILISDNFLKSTACMYDILSLFDNTEKMDKYAFVIVDGIDETGHPYETKLSDINHVIQYMNYWQAKYDTLRNEIAKDGDIGAHEKSSQLIKLQDIAGSTGEFLRILRKDGLVTYADLMKDEQELLMAHLKNKNVPKEDKVSIPTNNSTDNSIQDIVFESKKLFSESKKSNPIIQKIIEKEKQQQDSNPLFNKSDSEEAEKVRSVLSKLESMDMEDVEDNDQSIGQFPFSKPDDIDISAIENSKLDLLILGDKLIENGDYSQAVRVLETFVKHQADHIEIPNARLNIARLCTKKLNQFEKATEQLEILISKGNFVIESYLLLAQIAELNHNHISAKSLYDKIISIDP